MANTHLGRALSESLNFSGGVVGGLSQMHKTRTWHRFQLVILGLVTLSLSGCPQAQHAAFSNQATSPVMPVSQAAIAPSTLVETEHQVVAFDVCSNIPDWERPDWATQMATLESNPRYSGGLDEEPLQSLSEKFWNESVITFTTYGLSARTEPIYFSGVWTAIEAMDTCYEGDRPDAINQGQLAEVWLIGHRIVSIEWSGDQYQITVEPTSQGLQSVQFERLEALETLPIMVVETDGTEVAFASGDW